MTQELRNHGAVPLKSGINGENQAIVLSQAVKFTRVELEEWDGAYPVPNEDVTALVNKVGEGVISEHYQDPDISNQRILIIKLPPTINVDIISLLLFAESGGREFAHTHIILAAKFPIRTPENQGTQGRLKITTRVNPATEFAIHVSPDISYPTREEVEDLSRYLPMTADFDTKKARSYLFASPDLTGTLPRVDDLDVGATIWFDRTPDIPFGYLKPFEVYDPADPLKHVPKLVAKGTDGKTYEGESMIYRYDTPIKATLNKDKNWGITRGA